LTQTPFSALPFRRQNVQFNPSLFLFSSYDVRVALDVSARARLPLLVRHIRFALVSLFSNTTGLALLPPPPSFPRFRIVSQYSCLPSRRPPSFVIFTISRDDGLQLLRSPLPVEVQAPCLSLFISLWSFSSKWLVLRPVSVPLSRSPRVAIHVGNSLDLSFFLG